MLDWVVRGALVVDGSGSAPFTADVGVRDGRITEVGRITEAAQQQVDGTGAWLTPGFVDIHTHYDGQASWDATFSPSIHHGVTTLVMGNCGVGFAPHVPGREADLIALMEGVEDIPGVALAEGVAFNWRSFTDYMNVLEAQPHTLDFLTLVPHDPLRMAVMGERALAHEMASPDDVAAMQAQLRSALKAGAAGFSTGRTDNHRTAAGTATPASDAGRAELIGLGQAFAGLTHGVVQMVSDFDLLHDLGQLGGEAGGPPRFDAEFDLIEDLARAAGRPLSMSWMQRDPGGAQWAAMQARVERAVAGGLPLYLQTATRGIGVITGLDAATHVFMGFPGYQAIAHLPLAQQAAALRDPALKAQILAQRSERRAGTGSSVPPIVDILLARIEQIAWRMFALRAGDNNPPYEPPPSASLGAAARARGCSALEAIYDHMAEGDGANLIYFPIFNYNAGNLDVVGQMLQHPRALYGLSDAGAHVGTICDASSSTFLLTHWVQNREQGRLPLQTAIEMLSSRSADYLGLHDRGRIAPGLRADLNLIDPQRLRVGVPQIVRDLPAGSRRLLQRGEGYVATWVHGRCVQRNGDVTDERPGRLVRMGQADSA